MATNAETTELTMDRKLELIEQVVESSNLTVIESMPKLAQGLALARGMKQLRELVDDEVMSDVMELQGSSLGFRTDKDDQGGYPVETVKDAMIHAMLRGASPYGNEWNIISGKAYLTKEYYERQVRQLVHDLRLIEHVPAMSNGGALVPMEASWVYEGRRDELKCLKTDEGDARIAVRVNKGMGVDAIIGKATRKMLARIYRRVTGSSWLESEADANDTTVEVAERRIEHVDPLAGLAEAVNACETVREVDAVQHRYTGQVSGEEAFSTIMDACDTRRDAIRAERGERSNGQTAAN